MLPRSKRVFYIRGIALYNAKTVGRFVEEDAFGALNVRSW